jgi:tetratricopeptide (TPR) repeat protein
MSAAGVLAAVALLAAAGCSAPPTTPAADGKSRDPSTLTLFAELALEHGDCKLSSEDYAAAAMHSGVAIARRASEVSLACENLPAAWQSVQRWRALAPQDADAAASYAAIALKLDKIPQARAAVATVVQAAGANTDARVAALTTTLLEEAEAPVVLAALSPAVEPKASAVTLALLAELALEAYDTERAAGYAHAALAHDANLVAAKRVLARVYVIQANAPEAIATAHEVMAADPAGNAFELAEILIELDRLEEARQELERLRASGTPSNQIDQRLALLAFQDGDLAEAQRRFADLAAHGAATEGVILSMADIAARDSDDAAALAGYKQLENSSIAITARTRAAAILLKTDRAAAFALLDEYAVAHPEESFELTLTKIHLLRDHEEGDAALALIQAALERHPGHPALEYENAVVLESAGKVPESIAALERLIAERPDDATLLNALGYTLADHNLQLPRAEKLIRRSLASTPDNPAVLDSLGWVRFRRGDARGAIPILERAYSLGRDSDVAAHLGEVLWQSGDQAGARKVFAAALAKDPDSELLKGTLARILPSGSS